MGKRSRSLDVLATSSLIVFFTLLFAGCTAQVSRSPTLPALLMSPPIHGYKTSHVFIVVMDGVRYSETFGDDKHQFIPHLYNDLKPQGTLFTNCYVKGVTVTRQGHSTLISGTWQRVHNGGPRLSRPTLFEYYRDEKSIPEEKCWSIFGKARYAFEPYSSHPAYGSRFAGKHIHGGRPNLPISENSAEGDVAVLNKVIEVMKTDQPDIVFINFGYTDHSAHVAKDIKEYWAAIKNCDEQMGKLWNTIQADPHYRDTTTVFFTNDHGRHTRDFHSHGDPCEGCQHIMLLILGPDIKKGVVVDTKTLQIDVAPTAGELLGLQTPLASGRVLNECLTEYLRRNRKEAVTETARHAMAIEKLADRNLVKVVADYVLTHFKPETVPSDLEGELLLRGVLLAYRELRDKRYLEFVQKWMNVHKSFGNTDFPVTLGNVILELPEVMQQEYITLARRIADQVSIKQMKSAERTPSIGMGAFLGRLSEVTKETQYAEMGLKIITTTLSQTNSQFSLSRETGEELVVLGQAAAVFREDDTVMKAFVTLAFQALRSLKEDGILWDDPIFSVLALYGIEASKRGAALREFVQEEDPLLALPSCVKAITGNELRRLFPDQPKATESALQKQIFNLIFERGKQSIPFSLDMLRYGVNQVGVYGDGALIAQGAFLLSFRRLQWRYGGSTWPGPEPPKRP